MIKREHYVKQIRPFYDSDLIKIITGIRRCGKSVILKQVYDELVSGGANCIFLDFDLKPIRDSIGSAEKLIEYIREHKKNKSCYVFLDEVQNVTQWSEACRSLRLMDCSVFISGSNSRLLSKEFTKELSGRYVSFRIRPFVYKEILEYMKELGREYSISDYLVWGGFPAAIAQPDIESMKRYLSDLNDTIIYNDLENRYQIRKRDIFERVVDYILVSNARIVSIKSIVDYLKGQKIQVSIPTVTKYIEYLKEAYVVEAIEKYSTKTKSKMSYFQKLYNEDVSFNSIRCLDNRYDITHNMENIVLNELLYKGYEVTVYEHEKGEIDFRASKDGKLYLMQVAYSVADEKAYEREFRVFNKLDNSIKKILITNDDIDYSTSTVEHIRLKNFLES